MDVAIASAAALAAVVSAVFVWRQVEEMKLQTRLQREISESASQPYIWADIRIQSVNGWNLEFVLGNSGATVATQVRVEIEPPFPTTAEGKYLDEMQSRLHEGLASLAPGRTLHWTLGTSPELVNATGRPTAHRIVIRCNGPFGEVPVNDYVLDFEDFRVSVARRSGSLYELGKSVSKSIDSAADRIGRRLEELSHDLSPVRDEETS